MGNFFGEPPNIIEFYDATYGYSAELSQVLICSLWKVMCFSCYVISLDTVNLKVKSNKLKLAPKFSNDTIVLTFSSQFVPGYYILFELVFDLIGNPLLHNEIASVGKAHTNNYMFMGHTLDCITVLCLAAGQ